MSEKDAQRAVTVDLLDRAIRTGTFSEEATDAARMLTPAELDKIRADGIPQFDSRKKEDGNARMFKGHLLVPRNATAKDILEILGLPTDGRMPPEPEPDLEPQEHENTGTSSAEYVARRDRAVDKHMRELAQKTSPNPVYPKWYFSFAIVALLASVGYAVYDIFGAIVGLAITISVIRLFGRQIAAFTTGNTQRSHP